MDYKTSGIACRDNVKSQLYIAGFGWEDGSFFWGAFSDAFIFEYRSTCSYVAVFGAFFVDSIVVRILFVNVEKFLLIYLRVSISFGEFSLVGY